MVSSLPNYYQLFGLLTSARPEEIKAAFRRLAKELHPDVNQTASAVERFQKVVEAYETLSDPKLRRAYDEVLKPVASKATKAADLAANKPGVVEGVTNLVGGLMDKLNRRWSLGQDLRYTLPLTLAEAYLGCEKTVRFESSVRCSGCNGSGRSGSADCPDCQGTGERLDERVFKVTVPSGSGPGMLTRIPGGGTPGEGGGPEGDLTFIVEVAEHPLLERQEQHLRCRVPLPVTTALAGGRIEVPTLEGNAFVTVPAGVQSGQVLRLEGRGIPTPKGPRGDLLITLELDLPDKLPENVRQLLLEAERQAPQDAYPRTVAYRKRLRELADD
jgi:DnaJ-class molecular chaperone